jgi:hypothetical protein
MSVRTHLQKAADRGHLWSIAQLDGPEVPEVLYYLLEYFEELALVRGMGMSGWNPIGYTEIMSWCQLTGRALDPHEVSGLVAMDAASRFPGEVDTEDVVVEERQSDWPASKGR